MFISGQIALNPKNGELIINNIIKEKKMVLKNVKGLVGERDLNFDINH